MVNYNIFYKTFHKDLKDEHTYNVIAVELSWDKMFHIDAQILHYMF